MTANEALIIELADQLIQTRNLNVEMMELLTSVHPNKKTRTAAQKQLAEARAAYETKNNMLRGIKAIILGGISPEAMERNN